MFSVENIVLSLGAKTCGQLVGATSTMWVYLRAYGQRLVCHLNRLSISLACTHFCTQLLRVRIHINLYKFTEVSSRLSTVSTYPTNTTTTFINNI